MSKGLIIHLFLLVVIIPAIDESTGLVTLLI
jgi:hypothetical protein